MNGNTDCGGYETFTILKKIFIWERKTIYRLQKIDTMPLISFTDPLNAIEIQKGRLRVTG